MATVPDAARVGSFDVKSELFRDAEVKKLSARNARYDVRLYYLGDYASDLAAGALDHGLLTMSARGLPELKLTRDGVAAEIGPVLLASGDMDAFMQGLDEAKSSMADLQAVVDLYFPGMH